MWSLSLSVPFFHHFCKVSNHFFRSVLGSLLQCAQSLLSCGQSVFSVTFAKWPITFSHVCNQFFQSLLQSGEQSVFLIIFSFFPSLLRCGLSPCSLTFSMCSSTFVDHFFRSLFSISFSITFAKRSITFAKWWTISFSDHFFRSGFSITFAMWFITLFDHFFNVFKHFCGSLFSITFFVQFSNVVNQFFRSVYSITFFDQFFDHLCKEVNHFCHVCNQFFQSLLPSGQSLFVVIFCDVFNHFRGSFFWRSLLQSGITILCQFFCNQFFPSLLQCVQSLFLFSLSLVFKHFFGSLFWITFSDHFCNELNHFSAHFLRSLLHYFESLFSIIFAMWASTFLDHFFRSHLIDNVRGKCEWQRKIHKN